MKKRIIIAVVVLLILVIVALTFFRSTPFHYSGVAEAVSVDISARFGRRRIPGDARPSSSTPNL